MKKLILAVLMAVPFAAAAQPPERDICGAGGCTDVISFVIKNDQGAVIDTTEYVRGVGIPYADVMMLKYVRIGRCMGNETRVFSDVLKSGGNIGDVFKANE